ncbi:MAG: hypothetical protein IID33_03915 [Planctomycetes bacterium]|nr:hypothetical protein [Planctomycetota bacterium]
MKRGGRRKKNSLAMPAIPRQVWIAGGKSCMWLGTLAGLAVGMYALEGYAKSVGVVRPTALEWANLPAWLKDPAHSEFLREIGEAAQLRSGDELDTADLCEWIGRRLEDCPWTESVERISKRQDGVIRIEATFRRPVTMIVKGGNAYLVDEKAVRLPRERRPALLDAREWILVEGVRGDVPKVGQAWNGKDALAGVKLVRILNEAYEQGRLSCWPEFTRVDVSNFDGSESSRDGRIRIKTMTPGALIHWGLTPGEEHPIECSTEDKLDRLDELFRKHNGFPKKGPIDVRPFDRILYGSPH